ncbi:MAG TPA: SgcJ/EcaC family oxidoreductase [Dokdonella sp.]
MPRLLGALAVLLAAGCADAPRKRTSAAGGVDAALVVAARPAIEAANADWLTAMRSRDASALASAYAETAVFVTRGGQSIVGRAAIERYYRAAFENSPPIVDGGLVEDGIATSGNLVYEWGHGSYTIEPTPGAPVANSGYYVAVWQADASGAWKIVRYLAL